MLLLEEAPTNQSPPPLELLEPDLLLLLPAVDVELDELPVVVATAFTSLHMLVNQL